MHFVALVSYTVHKLADPVILYLYPELIKLGSTCLNLLCYCHQKARHASWQNWLVTLCMCIVLLLNTIPDFQTSFIPDSIQLYCK